MNTTKKVTTGFTALAGLSLIATGLAFSQPAQAQAPLPPAPPMARPHRGGERHPELRRALASLERTETQLRRSARDFGGHREKAADLCHQAEQELQLALQDDKH